MKKMNKTKIDWCDWSWNPVTGCFHNCYYCYAAKNANRFGRKSLDEEAIYEVSEKGVPLPFGFNPTLYWYRLDEPQRIKKPQNIFVCSMADLFGEFIPDAWIKYVFEACRKAPQHRYLFLTKNSKRYVELQNKGILRKDDNFWYGITLDKPSREIYSPTGNVFVSYEPMIGSVYMGDIPSNAQWIILGLMTGKKRVIVPEAREILAYWTSHPVVKRRGIKIFMKDSIADIWGGEPLIQEYPWDGAKKQGADHE